MIYLLTVYIAASNGGSQRLEIIRTGIKFYFVSELNIVMIEHTNRRHFHLTLAHGK